MGDQKKAPKTIRWGIIGVGNVTEVKSGPGFQKAENSALVAVMRRNGDLAKDYAQRHGVPRWYDDADALINDPEVDAVYIATPPHVHQAYALACAAAGKPVYCEKPMALRFADCQSMIDSCAAANVPLWVAYYRRMVPKFVQIKELVDGKAIGDIHMVTTRLQKRPMVLSDSGIPWRVQPEISGGGLFVDVGSHTLDLLDYLLGPIEKVAGAAAHLGGLYEAEDTVSTHFTFGSGEMGVGTWSFTSFEQADETVLYGTKGKISFVVFDNTPARLETASGVQLLQAPDPEHIQQPLIQSIVNELNGLGACPSTGVSGARTTWVIDQILQEYR